MTIEKSCAVVCLMAWALPAFSSTIVDLGTLGGASSTAYGMNNAGQVVGYSDLPAGGVHQHAFVYSGGVMKDMGALPGGISSVARGINSQGWVAGYSSSAANTYQFLDSGSGPANLGNLGYAFGVNDSGVVVGNMRTPDTSAVAFSQLGSNTINLGTLGGVASYATGINNSGQISGDAYITGNAADHAFRYSGGTMSDLGTLGGVNSYGLGINASGSVVGYSETAPFSFVYHAFLYAGGSMTDLGTLGGFFSQAQAINAQGQIVGSAYTTNDDAQDAFLFSNGVMTDLNSLLPANSGWQLYTANAINDAGQIAGTGLINGQQHAFLLNNAIPAGPAAPTPEPASVALLGTGVALVMLRARKRTGRK